MTTLHDIALLKPADPPDADLARTIAARLGLPLVVPPALARLMLRVSAGRLSIDEPAAPGLGVAADFHRLDLRAASGGISRKQPIAKAIGVPPALVVDATAGLGADSVLLSALRYSVIAIERSPIVAAMLENGLLRASSERLLACDLINRISIQQGDARTILPTLSPPPDVIYLDPMFPPNKKSSALARKPVRILRELVGNDPDAGELFAVAMRCAVRRVVVKRRDDAPPLAPDPTMQFKGKSVRYDVYVIAARPCPSDRG